MKVITKYLNVTFHFYNLNTKMLHPLIDLDGDLQEEDNTQYIRLNYKGVFKFHGFRMMHESYDPETEEIKSTFYKYLGNDTLCRYIFHMIVCPKPSPVLVDDKYRLELFEALEYDLNEYMLSSWWLHHVSVNDVKVYNIYESVDVIEQQVRQEILKLS